MKDRSWNETKQFRDPVYGYIQVPAPYVEKLIDTLPMQRIKGVAQSGLRPLFAAATHDRFAHSVGVYRFAMFLYDSLHKSAMDELELRVRQRKISAAKKKELKKKLLAWKNLLAIACLLHDIGHPVQSHSMEFMYDDVFLHFPEESDCGKIQKFDESEWKRTAQAYLRAREPVKQPEENPYKDSPFRTALKAEKKKINDILEKNGRHLITAADDNYDGKPHERMSAYYILTDSILRKNIDELCASYAKERGIERCPKGLEAKQKADELDFICRMITGTRYQVPANADEDLEFSLRNCVIFILNGTIDADSMDYIMRNSFSSGYETSEVDHHRFCNAYGVYYEQGQFFPAWHKSALSVIEGFISARNYEPQWLYSHHKVVYHDVLFKEMIMDAVKYMALYGFPQETVQDCMDCWVNAEQGASASGSVGKVSYLKSPGGKKTISSEWLYFPFFSYVLSPLIPFSDGGYTFYRSVDGDIDNFFKKIHFDMEQCPVCTPENKERDTLIEEYKSLYEEYTTRKHKRSLWKSFTEYRQIVTRMAKRLDTNFTTINRYILELIEEGLDKKQFHLISRDDAKATENYHSEIIYCPRTDEDQRKQANFRSDVRSGIIHRNVPLIFKHFNSKNCRIKIVYPHTKDFSKEQVLIEGRHYALFEILDLNRSRWTSFPYLYFTESVDSGQDKRTIRDEFFLAVENYCRQRITAMSVGGNMLFNAKNGKIIRDVVHGDIFLPDDYLAIVDTPEFQRLRRIKQLATAIQVFPNAGHSRFSHSLGTYYVMTKIVEHFEALCEKRGLQLFHNQQERNVVLLSALLHDLGHGPYSHAFEYISTQKNHEVWTEEIIRDRDTVINQVLRNLFGETMPEQIADCIHHRTSSRDIFSFADIYPTLISSQLDADRLDYLMRDSYNTAMQFGNVDIQNLISAMRITVIGEKYSIAIDKASQSMVEHFLFGRFKMYEMVYFNAYKLFSEELLRRIFKRVKQLMADKKKKETIEPLHQSISDLLNGTKLTVQDYLRLDDAVIESQFATWINSKDAILSTLIHAFLCRNRKEIASTRAGGLERKTDGIFRRIRVFYEQDVEVQDLLQQIQTLLRKRGVDRISVVASSQDSDEESYAFINIMRHCKMYTGTSGETNDEKAENVIWLLRENGTVENIGKASRMLTDEFHKSYLYYCEDIFETELKQLGLKPKPIADILGEVNRLMERVHPRHMIEIEEKYCCNETTLGKIKNIISQFTEMRQSEHEGFYLERCRDGGEEVLQEIRQIDTYYDLPDNRLQKADCSFRCRYSETDKSYVFTIKRPTGSENFGKNEQFARFEFERNADSDELIPEVLDFVQSHLAQPGGPLSGLPAGEIGASLKPILTISNARKKGIVHRITDTGERTSFKAEICLDEVVYKKIGDTETEKSDWQIEVELKSDYLDRILLKKFTSLIRDRDDFVNEMRPESSSKYQKALSLLGIWSNRTAPSDTKL